MADNINTPGVAALNKGNIKRFFVLFRCSHLYNFKETRYFRYFGRLIAIRVGLIAIHSYVNLLEF